MKHAIIAVCTYQRPKPLNFLLTSMQQQVVPKGWSVEVLVIDNDPAQSAEQVVMPFCQNPCARRMRYISEPRSGVANARNRALIVAQDAADALIFFDDDQAPSDDWLAEMLKAADADSTAVWSAPVRPLLTETPPTWARDCWPWTRPEHPYASELGEANSGNLLLPREAIRARLRFTDPAGTGMGEDTAYTRGLTNLGFTIKYAPAAICYEVITPDRLTISWVLRRARLSSVTWARLELARPGGLLRVFFSLLKNVAMAVNHGVRFLYRREATHLVKCERHSVIVAGYLYVFTHRAVPL